MQKQKSFVFEVELYHSKVHVLYLFSDEELYKYMNENFPGNEYERPTGVRATSLVIEWQKSGEEYVMDFVHPLKKDGESIGTIAHECLHVTFSILNSVGIGFSLSSEEAFNYLLGCIVQQTYRGIFENGKEK